MRARAVRAEYDFSKAGRAPYAGLMTKAVTLNLDEATFDYFTSMATALNVPMQTLINLYLKDCARSERKLSVKGSRKQQAD